MEVDITGTPLLGSIDVKIIPSATIDTTPINFGSSQTTTASWATDDNLIFTSSSSLPDKVGKYNLKIIWKIEVNSKGVWKKAKTLNTEHVVYLTYGVPIEPSDFTKEKIIFSCVSVQGENTIHNIASDLTYKMNSDLGPWQDYYNLLLPTDGPCQSRAKSLKKALEVLGISSEIKLIGEQNTQGQWH